MSSPTLEKYAQPVPICKENTSLESLLEIFQSSEVREVVLLNNQQYPIGIIHLHHLFAKLRVFVSAGSHRQPEMAEPITNFSDPVTILSGQMQLTSAISFLQAEGKVDASYAVVNNNGDFLGLLDTNQLLQTLLIEPSIPKMSASNLDLLPLLEQLPIPLMLQTETGEVLGENLAWREQVEIPSTSKKGNNAAAKNVGVTEASNRLDNVEKRSPSYSKEARNLAVQLSVNQQQDTIIPKTEKEKINPLSQTASEKVWQFIRLPLNISYTYRSQIQEATPEASPVWIILATDVTEQQQLCKELAAKNADLVQLNRLKDEFLACISHELKTPLTAILGLSNLLKGQSLGELNPRQARYARMVYQSGRQLMNVVNDIFDLTRLETGQLQLNLEVVKVKPLCDRAYEQALEVQKEKDTSFDPDTIDFTLELEPGIETLVADELRLFQMLVHLLSNALKFTQGNNKIGLRVHRWEGWIAIIVWDTGIGIPFDSQHLIFQKFQQLESPLTRSFEGTGLGLVLTQRLARAHGGDISFVSKTGIGSEFTLLLPPTPPPQRQYSGQKQPTGEANRLVLIVEAVPQYIENLNNQLRDLGYRVAIARSGTEALEKARQLQPRIILLNPLLPLLSGWDVLTLLKADPKTQEIPVVIVATRAEKQQAQQHHANGFLSLPVEPQPLEKICTSLSPSTSPAKAKKLTLLYLNPQLEQQNSEAPESENMASELNDNLRNNPLTAKYRFLEVSDPEQANLLARVWHPDFILMAGVTNLKPQYLKTYSQCEYLADLPLLTLDQETTQAAKKIGTLAVTPCLPSLDISTSTAILQEIQALTKKAGKPEPNILVISCWENKSKRSEWIQALTQYLQTAGLKTSLSHSWQEVYSQVQHQSIDLLVLDLGYIAENLQLQTEINQLVDLPHKPPILVLDHCPNHEETTVLENQLQAVANWVVCTPAQSMEELLAQVYQTLAA